MLPWETVLSFTLCTSCLSSFQLCLSTDSSRLLRLSSFFFPERGSQGALDLTELIGVPLPPSVSFVTGFEGYPAYSFGPDANVGRLTKSFIPDPFYNDFAVTVIAKPTTRRGGVLFAITDAYQKVRQSLRLSLLFCHSFFMFCLC